MCVPALSPDELVPRMGAPAPAALASSSACWCASVYLLHSPRQAQSPGHPACTQQSSFAGGGVCVCVSGILAAQKGLGVRVWPCTAPVPREQPFPRKIPSPCVRGQVFGCESSRGHSGPAAGQHFPAAGNRLRENRLLPTPAQAISCHPSWAESWSEAQIHRDPSGSTAPWFCSPRGRGNDQH